MKKIGLIAGNGRFPFLVAEEIKKGGNQVVAVALKEETDPALEKIVDRIFWINLGKLQKLIDILKQEAVTEAIMAGAVKHTQLFAGLKFDLRTIKLLASLKNKKADSILGAFTKELKNEGIDLLPSHIFLKHLLPKKGIITGKKLSKTEQKDVDFGYELAKKIAGLDIGQTVVVKDQVVVAIEAIEGTDECIRRAAKFGKENTVVVKVSKPKQDLRFDIPVIGPGTMRAMAESKARILAVEEGMTLIFDKEELFKIAKENNITILAV
ncbi:MAG: UDP-2,3-diacylglucosamine diphosphatase LpxI [Endomicrobiales bacterium]|nr:UDP-2,3-diacylglucosamine diphosphatase LpxI [Endomicrobiales bacterium]